MILYFAHGWGFDGHFWSPLAALLDDLPQVFDDRGYFGAPQAPQIDGPCLAVTHSLGTMRVLAAPPAELVGIVAINGFDRFTTTPERAGVPVRVVDRMLTRFEGDPQGVLATFRASLGAPEPDKPLCLEPLRTDLLRLRDETAPPPRVPIHAIHGADDPLLPAAMRQATLPSARHETWPGGHLLPCEAPELCAAALREMLAR